MLIDTSIIIVILLVIVTVVTGQPTFQQFLISYNKSYTNPIQYAYREKIYDSNLKQIIDSLLPPLNQYSLKTTKFMDWTDQQLSRLKAKLPPIINVGTNNSLNASNGITFSQFQKVGAAPLPTSLNWLTKGGVTPVKDQGDCGSCWSFSSVGLYQGHLLMQTGQTYNLSEQFTIQCNPYGTSCGGGDPARLLDFIVQVGLPSESDYPYDYSNGHFGICDSKNKVFLPENTGAVMTQLSTDQDLMEYLQIGPLVTLFSIHDESTFKIYSSGSYTGCLATTPFADLNHAVILIGYDETNWIIKNSWGTDWGMNGIAYISRSQNCGIGLFNLQLQTCQAGQYYVNPTVPNEYGYLLYKESIVCLQCPQQCLTCTSPTMCTKCQANQYLQAGACVSSCASYLITSGSNCICTNGSYFENGECRQCSSYCQTCVNTTYCIKCSSNYHLNLLDTSCYLNCPSGTQPINNIDCTCLNGTFLQDQSCATCMDNCQYCNNLYSCITCSSGYIASYELDQCNECPANCDTCLSQSACSTCQSGYVLGVFDLLCYKTCPLPYMTIKQGVCVCSGNVDTTNQICLMPCATNCAQCTLQNLCNTCVDGAFLNNSTGNCTKCTTGCATCVNSSTNCSSCFDGYYLINFICQKCPDNCTLCQSMNSCTVCTSGLTASGGICACSNSTYYYNGSCVTQCPTNMIINQSQCVCSNPINQYINGQCLTCSNLCNRCSITTNCLVCTANAQLQNGTCLCLPGYFTDGTQCTQCTQPCKQCLNATYCTQCQQGYKQYTSVCCAVGQYWNQSACLSCDTTCADCEQLGTCSSCPATYQLIYGTCQCNSSTYESNGSCISCVNPCYTCTNPTYCIICANPFIQLNGQCICPESYVKSGQQCLLCSAGCTDCLLGGVCNTCQLGYFLSNSTKACYSCPTNCGTCSNNITCITCLSPYTLLFSRCLLVNTGNITDIQPSSTQCPINCYLCYSSTACYQCQSNYYITQTLICVASDTMIWDVQQVEQVNPLIVVGAAIGNASCQLALDGNQTINLPFTTFGNVSTVQVGNNSVVYMGSSSFNLSGMPLIYGVPSILNSFVGTSPNRLATIIYRHTDCMSNQNNWWALALYENRTEGFEVSINKLPTGAQRYIQVTNFNQDQPIARVALNSSSKYYMATGYPCNISNNNLNCGVCDASHGVCLACINNYSLLDGACQQTCPTNYVSINWNCIASNSTPPSTKKSRSSKVVMWVFIGLAIGLVVTFAVLALLWYLRQRSEQHARNMNLNTIDGPPLSDQRIFTIPQPQSLASQTIPTSQPKIGSMPMLISQQNIHLNPNPPRRIPAIPVPYYS